MQPIRLLTFAFLALTFLFPAFGHAGDTSAKLIDLHRSDRQWTGVTVSQSGRVFANYPRWSDNVPVSVVELSAYGTQTPYPDADWNRWDAETKPKTHFICVQSVFVDDENMLWILDPANPKFEGVIPDGPKLVQIDLETDLIARIYSFKEAVIKKDSYLNDVRIDTQTQTAYMTDSGNGALVVLDLETGGARRVLDDHPSTHAEDVVLTVEGEKWLWPDGSRPEIHADGIALSPDRKYIYYQALSGRTMYRIGTKWLGDPEMTDAQLGEKVERVAHTGASDGIIFGPDGDLYLSSLEFNAVRKLTPATPGGRVQMVVSDPDLSWPDTFAVGPDGNLLVTTSQIHLGGNVSAPYRIWKIMTGR